MRNSIREETLNKLKDILINRGINVLYSRDVFILSGSCFVGDYSYTLTEVYLDLSEKDNNWKDLIDSIYKEIKRFRVREYPGVTFYETEFEEKSDIVLESREQYELYKDEFKKEEVNA